MDLESYIRQAAAARGINPDVAVRVAKSEGGLKDPVRRAEYVKGGYREPSYGPFQLLIGGGGTGFPTGMGNDALRAGIDPRDPNQATKAIDFALDRAKDTGWGAWYGAKAQGITGKMGIGDAPAPLSASALQFAGNNPQPGGFGASVTSQLGGGGVGGSIEGSAPKYEPPPFGTMAPGNGGMVARDNSIDPNVAKFAFADDKDTMGNRLSKAGQALEGALMPAPRPSAFPGGPSAEQANGLLKATNNTSQLAQMLFGRRMA